MIKRQCIKCKSASSSLHWETLRALSFCSTHCNDRFVWDIEQETLRNTKKGPIVILNDSHVQVAYMSLLPGEDVHMEKHDHLTQFVRVEQGTGVIIIDGKAHPIRAGYGVVIPKGTWHQIINTQSSGGKVMKLYTIYAKDERDAFEH